MVLCCVQAGVANVHLEGWVDLTNTSTSAKEAARYYCVLQHNHIKTFVDLSKGLCVNTWRLTQHTTVEQDTAFDGNTGIATLQPTLQLNKGGEVFPTVFKFESARECFRWAKVCWCIIGWVLWYFVFRVAAFIVAVVLCLNHHVFD